MNGCVVQPHHRRRDRSLLLALFASVAVHLMGGFAGSQVQVDTSDQTALTRRHAWELGGSMLLDLPPDDPNAEARKDEPRPPELQPPERPFWETMAEPPQPLELTLGIDGSTQKSDNMIGFREATPHSARQSQVDQPALDENAGSTVASAQAEGIHAAQPADAATPPGPPTPPSVPSPQADPMPAPVDPATSVPSPSERPSPAEGVKDGVKDGPKQPVGDGPADREEVKPNTMPVGIVPEKGPQSLDGPMTGEPAREAQPKTTEGAPAPQGEPTAAAGLMGPPAPPPSPIPPLPLPPSPPQTSPAGNPGDGGNAPATSSPQDAPGKTPGIKSDKEADASSKNKPTEVRFGQTVAADGVEIVTKKPRQPLFTKLTRVIAYPDNPAVEATFDGTGKVTDVKLLRSSGFEDVDDPVVNMVFTWRARGPKLAEISAGDPKRTFKLKFVILLR